ncbi:hypothetical protein [Hymenobacter sp. BT559]|uniref:hypothetical protein n=1 Tax=unclassified Hymenobacter TaxID=2615202 RepID=UPI00351C6619
MRFAGLHWGGAHLHLHALQQGRLGAFAQVAVADAVAAGQRYISQYHYPPHLPPHRQKFT